MGQKEVKIPTQDHVITFRLANYHHLEIEVHAFNQNRKLTLQNFKSFTFSQLPKDVKEQFHSIRNFYKTLDGSKKICCAGGRSGLYRIEFQDSKIVISKYNGGRQMLIKVHKVGSQSYTDGDSTSEQVDSKRVSIEDRLQKQVKLQKINKFQRKNQLVVNKTTDPHIKPSQSTKVIVSC